MLFLSIAIEHNMAAKERLESPHEAAMQVLEVWLQARGQVQVARLQKHKRTHLGTLIPCLHHVEPLRHVFMAAEIVVVVYTFQQHI